MSSPTRGINVSLVWTEGTAEVCDCTETRLDSFPLTLEVVFSVRALRADCIRIEKQITESKFSPSKSSGVRFNGLVKENQTIPCLELYCTRTIRGGAGPDEAFRQW